VEESDPPASTAPNPPKQEYMRERAVLRRRSALNFAGLAGATGLQFVLIVAVSRLLHKGEVGVFLEAFAIVRLASILFALGLDVTAIRYVAHHRALHDEIAPRSFARLCVLAAGAASTVGSIGLVATAPLVSLALHAPSLTRTLVVMAPAIPFGVVETVLTSVSRGRGSMRPYVWIDQLLDGTAKLVLVSGAAALGYGAAGAGFAYALGALVTLAAAIVVCWPLTNGAPFPDRDEMRPAARFAAFQWGTALSGVALLWVDSLILGAITDPAQVAVYSVSIRFALIGIVFVTPVSTALQPQIAACFARNDLRQLSELYTYATLLSTLLGVLP
jgi:O-antigen/teichoic acid export membrane protein